MCAFSCRRLVKVGCRSMTGLVLGPQKSSILDLHGDYQLAIGLPMSTDSPIHPSPIPASERVGTSTCGSRPIMRIPSTGQPGAPRAGTGASLRMTPAWIRSTRTVSRTTSLPTNQGTARGPRLRVVYPFRVRPPRRSASPEPRVGLNGRDDDVAVLGPLGRLGPSFFLGADRTSIASSRRKRTNR